MSSNAVSCVAFSPHCKMRFMELKEKKRYRFIVFKIDEKSKTVVVEKLGGPDQTYEDFTASLPINECRYAMYDFEFVTAENCQKSKIFFIAWSPTSSRIRCRMLYASIKERFKTELDGFEIELQARDPTEMDLDVMRARANYALFCSGCLLILNRVDHATCFYIRSVSKLKFTAPVSSACLCLQTI